MEETQEFDALLGKEFDFYGVDGNFLKLDDTVWEVVEDESDGYRSMLDTVRRIPLSEIFFKSPIARVRIEYSEERGEYGDEDDLYRLVDVADKHVWLTFGTEHADDYYPCFRFEYSAKPSDKVDVTSDQT